MKKKTFFVIKTLGCRLNRAESEGIQRLLEKTGAFEQSQDESKADLTIINSCAVTDQADGRSRALVRAVHRNNPKTRTYLTGCYATTQADEARGLPGVIQVVPNEKRHILLKQILKDHAVETATGPGWEWFHSGQKDPFFYSDPERNGDTGRSRAQIKIQDGCDARCTYCIVPRARGKGISRDQEQIIRLFQDLQDQGFREIVLTGVNTGRYRVDRGNESWNLSRLIEQLLDVSSEARIRLSSIEPEMIDERLIDLLDHPRFCNFLHIPVQSGSDQILRLMGRNYTRDLFERKVDLIRKKSQAIYIGTDVMVGFPGESRNDFEQTLSLVQNCFIQNAHTFRYSPRKDTPAYNKKETVSQQEKKDRSIRIQEAARENHDQYTRRMPGHKRQVIVEKGEFVLDQATWNSGLTDDYIRVLIETTGESLKPGESYSCMITGMGPEGRVYGSLVEGQRN